MKTLIIEIYKDPGQLKMSAFYKGESMGHRQYTVQKISESSITELCSDIFNVLDRTDSRGKVTTESLEELRKSSHLLYDQILSNAIKEEIRRTDATHLIFYIDEQLVHIPWELLHDGGNYLCLRFAAGRVVLTAREIQSDTSRNVQTKLKMLAVCDPTGDLKNAYDEGVIVRNELDKAKKRVHVDLRTTDVDLKYTMKNIREYDVFHFAGHAKYDRKDPSQSGFILKDGDLTAERISTLSGSASMPLLVFANACSSGETEGWRIEPEQQNRIYGLANTFLLAGVKYYIGTFWKVQDELSMNFAKIFYRNIRKNKSIGEALLAARQLSIEKYGQSALIWASYMLYGDSSEPLISVDEGEVKKEKRRRLLIGAGLIIVVLGFILAHMFLVVKEERPLPSLEIKLLKNVFYVDKKGRVTTHDVMDVSRDIAHGKEMYASTVESKYYLPRYAADDNLATRWSSKFSDPQWIYADLGEVKPIGYIHLMWQFAAGRSYDIQVSNNAERWRTVWRTSHGGAPSDFIDLRGRNIFTRYVRMYGRKRVTDWGYSLYEFKIFPDVLPNVALGKEAYASSGSKDYAAPRAVDDHMGTRWGSDYSDPQWLYVDLGREYLINMVTIHWEPAYGSLYKIQRSDEGKNWIDVCEINNDKSGENNIYFESPLLTRYIRLYGLERGTDWGYSIWELEVRGMKAPSK